jgi:putative ABC transport system permease protein
MTGRGARRLFRVLLAAYPRPFRETYGADMEQLFVERLADARARGGRARFLWRTGLDMAVSGCAERLATRRQITGLDDRKGSNMSGLVQDVSYTLRLLRRRPAFALFVVLTLAVGIGANTAMFSVVNGVLLRPLPYADPAELVSVWGRFDPESGFEFPQFPLSGPEFLDYQQQTQALEALAAFNVGSATVGGEGAEPERVLTAVATGNLFDLLGARPVLGRTFAPDEAAPGGAPVVVLSHAYWQSRFGADPGVVGRTVPINGTTTEIIGVMPEWYAHPGPATRMWMPLRIDPANPGGRSNHSLRAIGRLRDDVPLATARAELETLMQDWKRRFPDIHTGHYLFIRPTLEDAVGAIRPALLLLLGATGFVLLIVCANVASVVLARGEARTREMAIRGALGAERRRLVRLSLIESGCLGAIGGALGLALAYAGVRALIAVDPAAVPRSWEVGIDYRVVAFAAGTSMLSVVLFGLWPAMRGARASLQDTLREASLSTTASSGRQVFRRSLVGIEVALTVSLAIGAGLMLRSFAGLTAVDPGFRPDGLVSARLSLPVAAYREPASVETFYASLVARLEAMPGVTSASAGSTVPLLRGAGNWDFEVDGEEKPGAGQPAWNAKAVIVRPGYFETLGIRMVRGRFFTSEDDARAAPTVIVNEALAERFFAGQDPIGRRLRIAGATAPDPWMTIVGISGDMRTEGLDEPAAPAYHFLQSQLPRTNGNAARSLAIFARTAGDPSTVMRGVRAAVRDLDPSLALFDVQTMDVVVDSSVARPRFMTWLLGVFAAVGLLLGASGIYGVLAFTVARRTQEIGIRRALGARPGQIARHVVTGGMLPVFFGVAVGLLLAHWTARVWSAQLFGVSPTDPATYVQVTAAVLVVALLATVVPIRRALRVSPATALRAD